MSAKVEQSQLSDSYQWYTGFMPPDPVSEAEVRREISQDLGQRYQVQKFLGQGAFASVWKALDSVTDDLVAIKRFHGQLKTETSFYRELCTLFGLQHPHIVQVINLMESQSGRRYLVFEYCPGGNLRAALSYARDHQHPWPFERIREITQQIATALGFAHRRGFIHRDLKPENILFTTFQPKLFGGNLKLADFGLACGLSLARRKSESFDASRQLSGSPAYMAPEQFGGRICPASDFYALGVILYELWHQELPFRGSPEELAYQHINQRPTLSANIPEDWHDLLSRLLAKDPSARLADAEEVLRRLESPPAPSKIAPQRGAIAPHSSRCCSLPPLGVTLWQPQGREPEAVTFHAAGSFHAPVDGSSFSQLVPRAGCKAGATQPDGTLWLSAKSGVLRWHCEEIEPHVACSAHLHPFLPPADESNRLVGVMGNQLVCYERDQLLWQTMIERVEKTPPPLTRLADGSVVCGDASKLRKLRRISNNGQTLQELSLPGSCRQLIADPQHCWAKVWQDDRFQIAKVDWNRETVEMLPSAESWVWMTVCLPLGAVIAATETGTLARLTENFEPLAELELQDSRLRTFAAWDAVLAVLAKQETRYWLHTFKISSLC